MHRIAQEGENSEDDSWLGRIYHQFKHLMKDEDGSEPDPYNMEGLEPPMFDDTWGCGRSSALRRAEAAVATNACALHTFRGCCVVVVVWFT